MRSSSTYVFVASMLASLLFASCQPAVKLQTSQTLSPLDALAPVQILPPATPLPPGAELLGKVKVRDNGLSMNCSLQEVLYLAQAQVRAAGGNTLLITRHQAPDFWSTCHRIEAEIYSYTPAPSKQLMQLPPFGHLSPQRQIHTSIPSARFCLYSLAERSRCCSL